MPHISAYAFAFHSALQSPSTWAVFRTQPTAGTMQFQKGCSAETWPTSGKSESNELDVEIEDR